MCVHVVCVCLYVRVCGVYVCLCVHICGVCVCIYVFVLHVCACVLTELPCGGTAVKPVIQKAIWDLGTSS